MPTAIDHIIIVVDDLETAADRLLRDHGLASLSGGRHPGHGTGNRIVPLGTTYIELMAVMDSAEATTSPMGRWAAERADSGLIPAALCLRVDDIGPVAAALDESPLAMSRHTPDGRELSWHLAGFDGMLSNGWPFFIQWHTDAHPGAATAPHTVRPGDLARVVIPAAPSAIDLTDVQGLSIGSDRITATIPTADGNMTL